MCGVCFSRRGALRSLVGVAAFAVSNPLWAEPATAPMHQKSSNLIIKGGTLISLDSSVQDGPDIDIHVVDGEIREIGKALKIKGAEIIDAKGMIVMPGLIETHWHMWNTLLRNMAGDDKEHGYFPMQLAAGAKFTPDDNAVGVQVSLCEAIYSGVTTIHNWSHNVLTPAYADAEIKAMLSMGVRGRFSYGYSRNTKKNETVPFEDIKRVKDQWFAKGKRSLIDFGVASKGPLTNSVDVCIKEWEFARSLGLPITTHLGMYTGQSTGISALAEAGLLGPDNLLIHCTNASDKEIDAISKSGALVSLSPYTEMRTGFGIPPLVRLMKAKVPLSLSVDTTALSGNADMFAVMKAIQNIGDGLPQSEFGISPKRVLEMATIDGARALGIDHLVGSLSPGKRADILFIRTSDMNMIPATDPVRMVVQAAQPHNVDSVMVDGKFLQRRDALVGVNTRFLREIAQEVSRRVLG